MDMIKYSLSYISDNIHVVYKIDSWDNIHVVCRILLEMQDKNIIGNAGQKYLIISISFYCS